jgi:hypothetical protein
MMAAVLRDPAAEREGVRRLAPGVQARYSWDAAVDRLEEVYVRAAARSGRQAVR